ncbi:MAG: lytic murein transglycosylase, partial [Thermodesulfobacteriota bacterium]
CLTISLSANFSEAAENDFPSWLTALKEEAVREGVPVAIVSEALDGITLREEVISRDRNQPEFKLSFKEYLGRVVSERRVQKGLRMMAVHRQLLDEVAGVYKVQPRFLVALWGVETDFGRILGDYPVVQSLVTLAFDPRRSGYFRKELLHSLHILGEGQVPLSRLTGSWAGAIGGLQFMPSVYRKFAVDHDGDGASDVWRDPGDMFASGASYLAGSGWQAGQTWGREVYLPDDFDESLAGHKIKLKLAEWQALGVRRYYGRRDLPVRDMSASLIIPEKRSGRAFLVYDNFEVILKWNRSDFFGLAVGILADRIREE